MANLKNCRLASQASYSWLSTSIGSLSRCRAGSDANSITSPSPNIHLIPSVILGAPFELRLCLSLLPLPPAPRPLQSALVYFAQFCNRRPHYHPPIELDFHPLRDRFSNQLCGDAIFYPYLLDSAEVISGAGNDYATGVFTEQNKLRREPLRSQPDIHSNAFSKRRLGQRHSDPAVRAVMCRVQPSGLGRVHQRLLQRGFLFQPQLRWITPNRAQNFLRIFRRPKLGLGINCVARLRGAQQDDRTS